MDRKTEGKERRESKGIENRIAEWMLDPEAEYPWGKGRDEEEMETHEQFLSMAGIMYKSIKTTGRRQVVRRKR